MFGQHFFTDENPFLPSARAMEADFTFSSVISNTSAASVVLISSMSHSVKLSVIVRQIVHGPFQ